MGALASNAAHVDTVIKMDCQSAIDVLVNPRCKKSTMSQRYLLNLKKASNFTKVKAHPERLKYRHTFDEDDMGIFCADIAASSAEDAALDICPPDKVLHLTDKMLEPYIRARNFLVIDDGNSLFHRNIALLHCEKLRNDYCRDRDANRFKRRKIVSVPVKPLPRDNCVDKDIWSELTLPWSGRIMSMFKNLGDRCRVQRVVFNKYWIGSNRGKSFPSVIVPGMDGDSKCRLCNQYDDQRHTIFDCSNAEIVALRSKLCTDIKEMIINTTFSCKCLGPLFHSYHALAFDAVNDGHRMWLGLLDTNQCTTISEAAESITAIAQPTLRKHLLNLGKCFLDAAVSLFDLKNQLEAQWLKKKFPGDKRWKYRFLDLKKFKKAPGALKQTTMIEHFTRSKKEVAEARTSRTDVPKEFEEEPLDVH